MFPGLQIHFGLALSKPKRFTDLVPGLGVNIETSAPREFAIQMNIAKQLTFLKHKR